MAEENCGPIDFDPGQNWMKLRDYYIGQALMGLLANPRNAPHEKHALTEIIVVSVDAAMEAQKRK